MTAPKLGMSGDEWTIAMAYYGALWPQSIPSEGSADAWRTVYGHLALDDALAAMRMLASQFARRYGPAAGEILEAAAAIDKARRAVTEAHTAPALPASTDPHVARNQRRARVLDKLLAGALNRDGSPTSGFEDDPDLWADVDDPLIPQMRQAHLTARAAHPTLADLQHAHRAQAVDALRLRTNPQEGVEPPGSIADQTPPVQPDPHSAF